MDKRWEILDEIEDWTPETDAGRQAKAKIACFLLEENYGSDLGSEGAALRFAFAVLTGMAGSAA